MGVIWRTGERCVGKLRRLPVRLLCVWHLSGPFILLRRRESTSFQSLDSRLLRLHVFAMSTFIPWRVIALTKTKELHRYLQDPAFCCSQGRKWKTWEGYVTLNASLTKLKYPDIAIIAVSKPLHPTLHNVVQEAFTYVAPVLVLPRSTNSSLPPKSQTTVSPSLVLGCPSLMCPCAVTKMRRYARRRTMAIWNLTRSPWG
jgi:hypothetical protein